MLSFFKKIENRKDTITGSDASICFWHQETQRDESTLVFSLGQGQRKPRMQSSLWWPTSWGWDKISGKINLKDERFQRYHPMIPLLLGLRWRRHHGRRIYGGKLFTWGIQGTENKNKEMSGDKESLQKSPLQWPTSRSAMTSSPD